MKLCCLNISQNTAIIRIWSYTSIIYFSCPKHICKFVIFDKVIHYKSRLQQNAKKSLHIDIFKVFPSFFIIIVNCRYVKKSARNWANILFFWKGGEGDCPYRIFFSEKGDDFFFLLVCFQMEDLCLFLFHLIFTKKYKFWP